MNDRLSAIPTLGLPERVDALAARGLLGTSLRDSALRRRARAFVDTDEVSGVLQFAILVAEGCVPGSYVLEIGCGALHAAVPTVAFLEPGHWVGVDPTEWLREAAMTEPAVKQLMDGQAAQFLNVDDFDASSLGMSFDFVLAHSILSHAAGHQLEQFLANTGKVLRPGGRIVASLRLAEGNDFGSAGSPDGRDSNAPSWVYPGASYFTRETVRRCAEAVDLDVLFRPEHTAFYTAVRPNEFHDWVVFTH